MQNKTIRRNLKRKEEIKRRGNSRKAQINSVFLLHVTDFR